MATDSPRSRVRPLGRLAAVVSLVTVTASFVFIAWHPVGVFAVGSLRFWADNGLALGLAIACVAATVAMVRQADAWLSLCVSLPLGGLLGATVSTFALFPSTRVGAWGSLLLCAVLWFAGNARLILGHRSSQLGLALGALAGALHLVAKIPPPAHTSPLARELPPLSLTEATVDFPCGTGHLRISPTLVFTSTSRDGFWPGLSTPDELEGEPVLEGPARRAQLALTDAGVEAFTEVPHEVCSHLNRFTQVTLSGFSQPMLRFDPLETAAPFLPYDYPKGRPIQFAWVSGHTLSVARASDAEKGPFLVSARADIEVLSLTILEGAVPQCTLRFPDFVAQADTVNESPTTGEHVAPNAIQFGIPPRGAQVPLIHLTLAETSIGAGLETVRHAAGVYRNRVEVSQSSKK